MITFKPSGDKLLVKPIDQERSVGKILVVNNDKEKVQQGEVIAVGPGKRNDEGNRMSMAIAVGDTIVHNKYAGVEATLDGTKYIILTEEEVLGVI